MSKEVRIEGDNLSISIPSLLNTMSKEDQLQLIKSMAVQDFVLDKAIDYICGEDKDGWWTSLDDNLRMKLLTRVENAQIKKWSRYNWEFIQEATARLKEIKEKKHIYWSLYHGAFKDELSERFHRFCKANNIVSEYTTEQANKEIEQVINIIKTAMDKLKGPSDDGR